MLYCATKGCEVGETTVSGGVDVPEPHPRDAMVSRTAAVKHNTAREFFNVVPPREGVEVNGRCTHCLTFLSRKFYRSEQTAGTECERLPTEAIGEYRSCRVTGGVAGSKSICKSLPHRLSNRQVVSHWTMTCRAILWLTLPEAAVMVTAYVPDGVPGMV